MIALQGKTLGHCYLCTQKHRHDKVPVTTTNIVFAKLTFWLQGKPESSKETQKDIRPHLGFRVEYKELRSQRSQAIICSRLLERKPAGSWDHEIPFLQSYTFELFTSSSSFTLMVYTIFFHLGNLGGSESVTMDTGDFISYWM